MSSAVCCDPTLSLKMQPDACKTTITNKDGSTQFVDSGNTLCVNAASSFAVKNLLFQKFVCPASKDNCPKGSEAVQIIDAPNKEFIKEWYWYKQVPAPDSNSWNCKIKV